MGNNSPKNKEVLKTLSSLLDIVLIFFSPDMSRITILKKILLLVY